MEHLCCWSLLPSSVALAFAFAVPSSAFSFIDRAYPLSGGGEVSVLLSERHSVSRILRFYDPNVPGLVATTFSLPVPSTFLSDVKDFAFPEIQHFIAVALGVILVSLLLRGLIS